MKFAVGYQLAEEGEERFVDIVHDFREHLAEVYFPWSDMPSGRAALTNRRGYVDWTGQKRAEEDLLSLKEMGVALDLLFNSNCYGADAVSEYLRNQVVSVLEHLDDLVGGVETVTTTSLTVARTVKDFFPETEVRASVNMRIGTIRGMQYVAGLFDGFCVQREFNRDPAHLRRLKDWADENGKHIYMLANSGCLNHCSGQTFHDNLVAHEKEIDERRNIPNWTPHVCWNFLKDRTNWPVLLQNSWVRPEDLHHYQDLFPFVKLATRMHSRPRLVIQAFCEGRYRGNLLDLFEPGHGPALHPYIIDNERFPRDWFGRTTECDKQCERCTYCAGVLERTLVKP